MTAEEANELKKKTKWWGWGDVDSAFHLEEHPHFWPYLQAKLELAADHAGTPVPQAEIISLPDSNLNTYAAAQIAAVVGRKHLSRLGLDRPLGARPSRGQKSRRLSPKPRPGGPNAPPLE